MTNLNNHELTFGELNAVVGGEKANAFAGATAKGEIHGHGGGGGGGGDKEPGIGMVVIIGLCVLFGM